MSTIINKITVNSKDLTIDYDGKQPIKNNKLIQGYYEAWTLQMDYGTTQPDTYKTYSGKYTDYKYQTIQATCDFTTNPLQCTVSTNSGVSVQVWADFDKISRPFTSLHYSFLTLAVPCCYTNCQSLNRKVNPDGSVYDVETNKNNNYVCDPCGDPSCKNTTQNGQTDWFSKTLYSNSAPAVTYDGNNNIYIATWFNTEITNFVELCKKNNISPVVAIGGWSDFMAYGTKTWDANILGIMLGKLCEQTKLDGIDIDFEHLNDTSQINSVINMFNTFKQTAPGKTTQFTIPLGYIGGNYVLQQIDNDDIWSKSDWNKDTFENIFTTTGYMDKEDTDNSVLAKVWEKASNSIDYVSVMAYDAQQVALDYNNIISNLKKINVPMSKIIMGFEPGHKAGSGVWEGPEVDKQFLTKMTTDNEWKEMPGIMIWAANATPKPGCNGMSDCTLMINRLRVDNCDSDSPVPPPPPTDTNLPSPNCANYDCPNSSQPTPLKTISGNMLGTITCDSHAYETGGLESRCLAYVARKILNNEDEYNINKDEWKWNKPTSATHATNFGGNNNDAGEHVYGKVYDNILSDYTKLQTVTSNNNTGTYYNN